MIPAAYMIVLAITLFLFVRHFRGRTLKQIMVHPPAGADINAIVAMLSYVDHEIIKHRLGVVLGLLGKKTPNEDDRLLLARTVGQADASIEAEYLRYLDGVQRGAGRTLVNFERDPMFAKARRDFHTIQRSGQRWVRESGQAGPSPAERQEMEQACRWLVGPFREALLDLVRSVFHCPVTRARLMGSARCGILEAGRSADLTVAEPFCDCTARILAADLDIVIRNLVRNAAQAIPADGRQRCIHIEVSERIDETGEESILIRIHDMNPIMLSRQEIYGREGKRGLGLVTATLARHQGALFCVPSKMEAFSKAMEVRLMRSMVPSKAPLTTGGADDAIVPHLAAEAGAPRAIQGGPRGSDETEGRLFRPARWRWIWVPFAVLVHVILIAFVLVPYYSVRPLSFDQLQLPEGCHRGHSTTPGTASVVCEAIGPRGMPALDPIRIEIGRPPAGGMAMTVTQPGCPQADLGAGGSLTVDPRPCFEAGRRDPRLVLRFSSLWYRRESELRIRLTTSAGQLMDAARAAFSHGDAERARTLLGILDTGEETGRAPSEILEALHLQAQSAFLQGFAVVTARSGPNPQVHGNGGDGAAGRVGRGDGLAMQGDGDLTGSDDHAVLCLLADEVNRLAGRIRDLGSTLDRSESALWETRADYLLAESDLWLSGQLDRAIGRLVAIESFGSPSGPVQDARFYLILLAGEQVGGLTSSKIVDILSRMALAHERPPVMPALAGPPHSIELAGAAAIFGERQVIPVPEALCALLQHLPDLRMEPADLDQRQRQVCTLREVDPIVRRHVRWVADRFREDRDPILCPDEPVLP